MPEIRIRKLQERRDVTIVLQHGLHMPRAKPQRPLTAAAFRLFYLAQRRVPAIPMARALLAADRLVGRPAAPV